MVTISSSSQINPNSPKQNINWKYQFQQYGVALTVTIPLFVALSVYLFYRRGYYDLYIVNKIFAGVSAVLLGTVLLIGPGNRFFSLAGRYIQYRKELGIIAFFLALIHSTVSFFFLPSKFPKQQFFETGWYPFVFGLVAINILIVIFFISNSRAMNAIGRERWWRWQNWGVRFVFILVVLHIFIMKWAGWVKWYQVGGGKELVHPEWPGAGLLVGWFLIFVTLVRISKFIGLKFERVVWYISAVALPIVYIFTFLWGRQFI